MPTLEPPTRDQGPMGEGNLFYRYTIPRGVTLVVNGSTVTEHQYPSESTLLAATAYYRGGYIHEITSAEATVLTNAGYGAYIT